MTNTDPTSSFSAPRPGVRHNGRAAVIAEQSYIATSQTKCYWPLQHSHDDLGA